MGQEMGWDNIERVPCFKYSCYITDHFDPDKEVKCRIELTRATFQKMRSLFCNNNLNLKLPENDQMLHAYMLMVYTVVWGRDLDFKSSNH